MAVMNTQSEEPALELIGEGTTFKAELCLMIEQAQIFADLTRQEVEELASYMQAYEAKKGVQIFHEGEKGTFLCVVVAGRVEIYKETLERERKLIAAVRPGKSMGEMSVIDDQPHSASAVASQDSKLLLITKNRFQLLTQERPALGLKILWKLARLISFRLRQTTGILMDYLH
jgi:CRP-like cAMP-binding protein